MKRELIRAASLTLGLTLLLPFPFGVSSFYDYLAAVAFSALFVALLGLVIGFIAVFFPAGREFAQAMMLCACVLLLLSFTLCSTGAVRFL